MQADSSRPAALSRNRPEDLSAIRYPLSAIRYPLSAIRYPLSAIRYPLSAIRYPLSAIRRLHTTDAAA
ncbi:hypothetical protein [Sodalis praecaptivus]|uniref:hypothetical protein n=1 Tax=Sodalis praecaptivus TaxID=1239307 RepID=UPI00046CD03F|nr:hypothetical protein [Sodalis praecaptivus]